MTMPHIGIHLIPEETDLGDDAKLIHTGHRLDVIRFDHGMASGKTAVGIALPLADLEDPETGEPLFEGNTWAIAETSLAALRAAVTAIEARDAMEAGQ